MARKISFGFCVRISDAQMDFDVCECIYGVHKIKNRVKTPNNSLDLLSHY